MSEDISPGHHWRALYMRLLDHEGPGLTGRLRRWLDEHAQYVEDVREWGHAGKHLVSLGEHPEPDHYSPLEQLYHLSRVLDLLILRYQDPPADSASAADEFLPPTDAYPAFCDSLGAERIAVHEFHPFFHEIIEVRQADDPDEPPSVVEERWPGHLVGAMLLMRAGVVVRAGSKHLVAGVADRSTLYWTYRRRSRPTNDLSHGWGHNSQWGTDFRRDYVVDGRLHYNVDAAMLPGWAHEDALDPASAIELVRHRCSTVVDHGDDLFPFDLHHVEPAPLG
ncbi:hypothetical protein Pth03_10440 [Planotetraspora thailandica]|uniref:Uncharacterized protein n=1 Tax=Planotetraspora thailandica TaxID=487172 RepID=A0A8J3XU10_9ACTN|nr:hypothetical protein [Planotetraspora thailandica]GII52655.1 hypothetical protein Pth03_10440 [Planotetraspora thailandica]